MPTVLREDAYSFKIYPNDHIPAHVHVLHAENRARVTLQPIAVVTNIGFNPREISRILEITQAHQSDLLAAWDEYHDER